MEEGVGGNTVYELGLVDIFRRDPISIIRHSIAIVVAMPSHRRTRNPGPKL